MTDTRPIIGQFYRGGILTDLRLLPDARPTYHTPRVLPPTLANAEENLHPAMQVDDWRRTGRAEGTITVLEWMRLFDAALPEHDQATYEIPVHWIRYELDEPRRPRLTRQDVDRLGEVLPNGLPAYDLDPYRGVIRSQWGRLVDELVESMTEEDDA